MERHVRVGYQLQLKFPRCSKEFRLKSTNRESHTRALYIDSCDMGPKQKAADKKEQAEERANLKAQVGMNFLRIDRYRSMFKPSASVSCL